MKKRIVLFGCSHTHTHIKSLIEKTNDVLDFSHPGNANSKIIKDVYDFINSDNFSIDNDELIIQYSYTNRLWFPSKFESPEFGFHAFQDSPIYYLNDFAKEELMEFYQTYIKYFWNYDLNVKQLIMDIDLLKTFLESKKVKFIHWLFADGGNTEEWNYEFGKVNEEIDLNSEFKKLDLFEIDGYYKIGEWGRNSEWVDFESEHMGIEGCEVLAEKLLKKSTKKLGYMK
jgi:hypothetical protein